MQGSARIDELRQKFHENPRRYFAPLANEYRKAGDPEQAIAICRAHLAQQPVHMSGHVVYAQALYDAGRIDESRVVFEKALSLDPDNAIVLRQLGDISRNRGDTAEARHWYARALEADPASREIAAYIAELTEPLTETPAPSESPVQQEPVATAEVVPESSEEVAAQGSGEHDSGSEEAPAEPEAFAEQRPPEATPVVEAVGLSAPLSLGAESVERVSDAIATEDLSATIADFTIEPPDFTAPPVELSREADVVAHDLAPAEIRPAQDDVEFTADDDLPAESEEEFAPLPITPGSPFVTRTMADLYARQGYHEQALEVYQQLADANPNDAEIAERIRELSPADAPTEHSPAEPLEQPVHFTETELGAGDEWDTDSWAAGFSEEVVPFDFVESNASEETSTSEESVPETVSEAASTKDAGQEENTPEPASAPASIQERSDESLTDEIEQTGEFAAAPLPPGVLNETREEIPAAEFVVDDRNEVEEKEEYEPEPETESEHFVAYSPQPPEEEDLPHYRPPRPTIREFFATLGARRPPENGSAASFTAHAMVPEIDAAPEVDDSAGWQDEGSSAESATEEAQHVDEFPHVSDALANLFPDSSVSEEDTRAAFALSGALSSQPAPNVTLADLPVVTPAPAMSAPAAAVPPAAQESEEDIRRFREWLDGLADS